MKVYTNLAAELEICNGFARLRLCDEAGAPWSGQSGIGSEFFDALGRAAESGRVGVVRESGHRAAIVLRDPAIDTSWLDGWDALAAASVVDARGGELTARA